MDIDKTVVDVKSLVWILGIEAKKNKAGLGFNKKLVEFLISSPLTKVIPN